VPDRTREVYEFGQFRLDVQECTLERHANRERIVVPDKAFRTLVHLVRNSGALVTREAMLAAVWPGVVVEDGNIGKVIHIIRSALGDRSGDSTYIETVPKHGYRFIAGVTRRDQAAAVATSAAPLLKASPSDRSPAYDLYIRGKVKLSGENLDDTNEAIALLEAAVALDPSCAGAYAQLARAYNTRSFKFTSQADGKRSRERADVALAKALDLDPNLAESHFARGLILWTKAKGFPHEQAIRSFKKALELEPVDDETHHQLSMVYAHVGLLNEAHHHIGRAIELNPNNTMARFRAAMYAAWQCRFEDALTQLKTVPSDVSPFLVDRVRAEVYVQLGRLDKARPIIDGFLATHPDDEGGSLTGVRALMLAKAGNTREARRMIAQAIELGTGFGHFHHTAYNIAAAYAALHETNEAVDWIEAAADDGYPCYSYFERDPNLDEVRQCPQFVDLMAALHRQWQHFRRIADTVSPSSDGTAIR
jgi:DNA-binding winged helix-turn-helix (wHTH) protein/Flp pilus assembly protein TadD